MKASDYVDFSSSQGGSRQIRHDSGYGETIRDIPLRYIKIRVIEGILRGEMDFKTLLAKHPKRPHK